MESIRRINVSLAVFVMICFFLPWVQVSCGGARDSASGLDLARDGERLLWLIPLMMMVIIALALGRDWKRRALSFGLAGLVCGAMTAVLTFRERVDPGQTVGLVAVGMTAWFWLGLAAAAGIAVGGIAVLLGRPSKGPIGS